MWVQPCYCVTLPTCPESCFALSIYFAATAGALFPTPAPAQAARTCATCGAHPCVCQLRADQQRCLDDLRGKPMPSVRWDGGLALKNQTGLECCFNSVTQALLSSLLTLRCLHALAAAGCGRAEDPTCGRAADTSHAGQVLAALAPCLLYKAGPLAVEDNDFKCRALSVGTLRAALSACGLWFPDAHQHDTREIWDCVVDTLCTFQVGLALTTECSVCAHTPPPSCDCFPVSCACHPSALLPLPPFASGPRRAPPELPPTPAPVNANVRHMPYGSQWPC